MAHTIFNFFGLRENPFKINPDPRFLFVTDEARAASAELAYAIRTRKGLILLTGEVGTGKTMLLRRLLDWLSEQRMPTALIFNSHIKPDHLLDFILNDFGVPCTSTLKSEKLMALHRWLLERYRAGQIPVLIVDEAQGLDPAALEEIRLLLNFETPREKLLQIVLAGQPELEIKLKRHELRQLRQRITIRCRTSPLTLAQTHGYILERLRVAGANGNRIFDPEAVDSVYAYSHGIPRIINVLCEHSLINACADGVNVVSSIAVEHAAQDCQLDRAESVARILNTGSYSTTNLTDMGSILAAAEPPRRRRYFSEPVPAAPQDLPQAVQPSPAAAPVNTAAAERTPPEQHAAPNDIPSPAAARSYVQEPLQPTPQVESELTLRQTVLAQTLRPRRRASPLNFLRACGSSFISDVRAASRRLRRAVHSFEIRRWKPLVCNLRDELHQLRIRASSIWSDHRWKHGGTRLVSVSHRSWESFKSAILSGLAQYLGIHRQGPRKRPPRAFFPHGKRPRGIISLRRWLYRPLTSQRKRTGGNQRRSLS
jgi:general secretion pathway protein A